VVLVHRPRWIQAWGFAGAVPLLVTSLYLGAVAGPGHGAQTGGGNGFSRFLALPVGAGFDPGQGCFHFGQCQLAGGEEGEGEAVIEIVRRGIGHAHAVGLDRLGRIAEPFLAIGNEAIAQRGQGSMVPFPAIGNLGRMDGAGWADALGAHRRRLSFRARGFTGSGLPSRWTGLSSRGTAGGFSPGSGSGTRFR
jgi:hypothetical protein